LRQRRIGAGRSRFGRVADLVTADALFGLPEMRTRRAVVVDDSLAEQVVDGLAGFRLVGAEQIVEGVVFTDDDNDMLDRRRRCRRSGESRRDASRRQDSGGCKA
jgi:hypothetical protein